MNELSFIREGQTYTIRANGKAIVKSDADETAGEWSSASDSQKNQISIAIPGQETFLVDVDYKFVTNTDARVRNVLQLSIPSEGAQDEVAKAFFAGKILIDDRKDIEYRLDSGKSFFLYGDLSFKSGYFSELFFAPKVGEETSILGRIAIGDRFSRNIDEQDLLLFYAYSQWADENDMPRKKQAVIQLSGSFQPKNRQLVFHGKFEDEETFDIVLAGKYKVVAGALEIRSEEGDIDAALRLSGDLSFYEMTGKWGLTLGKSGDEIEMGAAISFDNEKTSKNGDIKIKCDAEVGFADNKIEAKLELDVQTKINEQGVLAFNLKGGWINGKPELVLKGSFIGKDDSKLFFELGYADNRAKIEIGYESEKIKAAIRIITDGERISGWFSVTITFADNKPVRGGTVNIPKPALPESEAPGGITSPMISTSDIIGKITPKTLPDYPDTGPYRSNNFDFLHPIIRKKVIALQTRIYNEGIPLYVFEAFRSPERQNELYDQGSGVTNAKAWQSYHQYGFAVDFVFFESRHGGWHWGKNEQHKNWYKKLHEYARELGLERLSWETPHLQPSGVELGDLKRGKYPVGGDSLWGDHLTDVIRKWQDEGKSPAAPPIPEGWIVTERPPLPRPIDDENRCLITKSDLDEAASFHSRYGGIEWKIDVTGQTKGVFIKGSRKPERTSGEPITCRKIVALYQDFISKYAIEYGVPEELIIMTIATETSAYRHQGYTGPATFRWEEHIKEYSAGPMQTLSETVRELIEIYDLPLDPFEVAPRYNSEPNRPPSTHPLYDPDINIRLGTLEIKHRLGMTGFDPILVVAAYNSGGLYHTTGNQWHLKSSGNHLDRAARWFGDVFAI